MTIKGQNRRTVLKATGAGLILTAASATPGLARTATNKASLPAGPDLRLDWQFRQAGTENWLPATVPGTVHTDLLASGKIDDPFYRTNERDQQWIDKLDWEYRTILDISEQTLAQSHIELVFAGLDTFADVYVNDRLVLQADNMFREWSVDIKSYVLAGANSLRVYFHSPIKGGLKKLAAYGFNLPATNDQSEAGGVGDDKLSVFARKAGYHYGWDWGPRFVTSGIWRPVTLRVWSGARIADLQIVQDSLTPERAQLTAVVEVVASQAGTAGLHIASPTDKGISVSVEVPLAAGVNTVKVPLSVAKPRLWWSNGLGDAFLYTLTAKLSGLADDVRDVTIGLRTVKVVQTPDADGQTFYVELNGVPVFMKGANYIPSDSFLPRVTTEVYERVVRSASDTNMNMLRVWGGGVYEDDRFYDLCDRHGILVWQDFMFACSMYPDDQAFLDNVRAEAVCNVRRLRNHACIALWVGNNEIDAAWQNDEPNGGWGWKQKYSDAQRERLWNAYKAIFLEILPSVVAEHDPQRFYWSSSPLAGEGRHADVDRKTQSGDIHYWDVWWGQKPFSEYRTHIGRFMSEYGFQSFPEFRTIESYTVPEDHDIMSEVMQAHQRSSIGNGTIRNYMQRDYAVPRDFKQFLYVGQVLQAEGIKVAMEAHRARMPYCMGSLFWQINDCWPVASWSSVDYYGRWKAQQYYARKAFAPVLVSPVLNGEQVTVTVVSDCLQDRPATLSVQIMDFVGKIITHAEKPVIIKANTAAICYEASIMELAAGAPANEVCVVFAVTDGSGKLSENILYLRPVKELSLPKPVITTRAKRVGDDIVLGITSASLVKNLLLTVGGEEGVFSDNYFDVLPGRTTLVTFKSGRGLSVSRFEQKLGLMHMEGVTKGGLS